MAVKVLGPLDTGTPPLSPRERAILSALVVRHGESMGPSELASAYWGDEPPQTWAQQVKTAVGRIRSRLGRESVLTKGSEYALGLDPESIDAGRFERLVSSARGHALHGEPDRAIDNYARALALWRGAAYPDLSDWQPGVLEAMRLADIRAAVEVELLEQRLKIGEARQVLPLAERLLREEPLREERWALVALANYQLDRQAEALATLRAARARLLDELGVEPGPRLRELEQRMLRRDPQLDPVLDERSSAACPYPGLRPFGPEDAEEFFGRDDDAEAIFDRLGRKAVVTIAGPSGSGKSSLLRAAVLPLLARRGGRSALLPTGATPSLLAETLSDPSVDVVAIDQAEEFMRGDGDSLTWMCETLADWVANGGCLVLTIRSDFLDRAAALPAIGVEIGRGAYVLGPLSEAALRDAVEKPAARAGLRVEPGLVELIVRDAGDRSSTLPHLSHALFETWARREGRTLTVAGYTSAGGIAGAIAMSAERVYQSLEPSERDVCRNLMLRLVAREPHGAAVRRRPAAAPLLMDVRRRDVIERLVATRLVSADEDSVVIAHEALATAWPRLDRWLDEEGQSARIRGIVVTAAETWEASARSNDDLLRGARLQAALEWREEEDHDLTETENAFLDESRARAETELQEITERARRDRVQNRRLRWALGGSAALLVAALAAGGIAVGRGDAAVKAEEDARIEAIAGTAASLRASDRDAAALVAASLAQKYPEDVRARSALLSTLTASGAPTTKIVFPDEEYISTAHIPGTDEVLVIRDPAGAESAQPLVEVWNAVTGEHVGDLDAGRLPSAQTSNPRIIFFDGNSGTAIIGTPAWVEGDPGRCCRTFLTRVDIGSDDPVGETIELALPVGSHGAFSPDGKMLVLRNVISDAPVWVDIPSMTFATTDLRAGDLTRYAGVMRQSAAMLPDGLVALGTGRGIDLYDPTTRTRVNRIATEGDVSTIDLQVDATGGLLGLGRDGIARFGVEDRRLEWQRPSTDIPGCGILVPDPTDGGFVCAGLNAVEYSADGAPTGRQFSAQSYWVWTAEFLADGSLILGNQRTTPFIVRFPTDGSGPLSTLVARGRAAVGAYADDTLVITMDSAALAADTAGQQVWDIERDVAVGEPSPIMSVVDRGVIARWGDGEFELASADGRSTWPLGATIPKNGIYFDGGPGPLAFYVAADSILTFDPESGEQVGAELDFYDKDLGTYAVQVHEMPGMRALVTWWDKDEYRMISAVFDLKTGEELQRGLYGAEGSIALADGDVISTTSSTMHRSSSTLDPKAVLPKPIAGATVFESSADGDTILLTGDEGPVALYDVASGTRLGDPIEAYSTRALSAQLAPDGEHMVTNARAGVLAWDFSISSMIEAACRMAGRSLTETEQMTYFGSLELPEPCAAREDR
ncbi:hypothetical protein G5T42_13665 [Microbacterium sp. 4R-513]|uniref:nSTAND1 domain-containing NTPase n=1 Tax=Microbacterium sp. 4R-513 TaxID=2567934 RepID=UPI0013E16360|nr:BTAD domain-containing putative transcriptional regulator [Microbacterium sp. 4R-513]QIG40392.1 hypothetical protein G5T42_13665 [Microbacterium sp. 4R-513]